jgi:PAS domain S-box-containing protein
MTSSLRLLVMEDSPADARLALRLLRPVFSDLEALQVDTLQSLSAALAQGGWDAILSDYSMPGLNFREIVTLVQRHAPDLPLVLFSGSIGEEEAVALLKLGVRDFVLKDRPGRLPAALQNALREASAARTQRETIAALAASEARFQATFDQAAVGMSQVALDGRILTANPRLCEILGYTQDELTGLTSADLSTPEDSAKTWQMIQRLCSGAYSTFTEEKRNFRKDGSQVWISLSVSLVRDAQGEPAYIISVVEDIQARKDAERVTLQADAEVRAARDRERESERQLNHLQRLESIGRLAGGVSHDINNVLAAVMAVASVMKARYAEQPELVASAGIIVDAATRGKKLVQGLTEFARKEVADAVPVDLNLLIRKEADLLEHTTLKKVAIHLELQEDLPLIRGDASALANALMNLCVNACDAMPGGGTLRLETRRLPAGHVEMAVQDTGEGMLPEVQVKALEPFFTTKAAGKGTGLGLSIVHTTVKAHGGTVALHSVPGQGTRIALAFPTLETPAPACQAPAATPAQSARPLALLLVDDDELIRLTLPLLLATLGHQIQVASDGSEALARLQDGLVADLVILDLNMPGLSGLETLERLRQLRPELPVLLASGFWDPAVAATISRFQRVACLDKPFRPEDLQRAMASIS